MTKFHTLASALGALTLAFSVAGCATARPEPTLYNNVGDIVYGATGRLAQGVNPKDVRPNSPVIITTIVSVDDLDRSSTFGRLTSQLILSKLAQERFLVKDVTYMKGVLDINRETGELVLSRDAERLSRDAGAAGVVVGTYAVGGTSIYVNMRMLSPVDGHVISSSAAVIPLDKDTGPLVWSEGPPPPAVSFSPPVRLSEPRG